jgi:putative protease
MTRPTRPELLAPAGDLDALEAAAGRGADAVYFGVGALNARVKAANLGAGQLPGVVRWLHGRGVRAYVTLNVPVQPSTVDETARVLAAAGWAGVDAVIVRDPLLMQAARGRVAGLEVHASTQFGVASVETARLARALGCTRAVLARELSAGAIARIRREVPDLEREVFVFGAMCLGVSGQCLLGLAVGGRAGNHGACVQACRFPYADAEGRPLGAPLSMKDLDLSPRLAELALLGVHALKIEGRLKPAAWVGCVTHWLRKGLDRSSPGLTPAEQATFDREVSVLFSRPRSVGYFDGATDAAALLTKDAPGHRGYELPTFEVLEVRGRRAVRFEAPVPLQVRDGLLVGTAKAEGGTAWRPVSIQELRDARGRSIGTAEAGETVEVPLGLPGRVVALAVHSAARVRQKYEKVDEGLPSDVRRGELAAPTVTAVALGPDRLALTLSRGRFTWTGEAPVATQPARDRGFDPALAQRFFGPGVACTATPGLFVNPSDLKRARRELSTAFEAAWTAALDATASDVAAFLRAREAEMLPPDDVLLAHGTALVTRVTGLSAGTLRADNGTLLEVVPRPDGTELRVRPARSRPL